MYQCDRLKSDYRYNSKDIVHNNFPWSRTYRRAIQEV